ncbi:MAG: phosphoribosylanthranilate isomerase [Caldilinea sp. CFX5]|nr:phosphoribosylanthranilate isomerase [Caldilinea sp. CFX5]
MTRTVVKICGLTNRDDARVAVAAGADLLGFIFYAKSPRYVTPETAAEIVRTLREDRKTGRQEDKKNESIAQSPNHSITQSPKYVGVFVNAGVAEIQAIVAQVGLDFVQLHGNETAEWFAPLAGRAYKAVRPADAETAQAQAEAFAPLGCVDGPTLLIDAYDPQAYGGTGKQTDWHVAAALARRRPGLLLAGGLTPENVAAAIAVVQPWGVDVASGVEAEPGRKDHAKVRRFVEEVRALHYTST